jgi:Rrf2 family protein
MLCLSQTSGYAIKALGCLNDPSQQSRMIADIAQHAAIPKPYLAKILSSLARRGLVKAKRGYRGGVSLARTADRITLLEIVEAVEGKHWLPNCLLGLAECSSRRTCPTHGFWERIRREITEVLQTTTLVDVIPGPVPSLTPASRSRRPANGTHDLARPRTRRPSTRSGLKPGVHAP